MTEPTPNIYGITALKYVNTTLVAAMMGLIDSQCAHWELNPSPTRLTEVVDRLVEGDTVFAVFPDLAGGLQCGPEIKVQVLADRTETLALAENSQGHRLADLPHF